MNQFIKKILEIRVKNLKICNQFHVGTLKTNSSLKPVSVWSLMRYTGSMNFEEFTDKLVHFRIGLSAIVFIINFISSVSRNSSTQICAKIQQNFQNWTGSSWNQFSYDDFSIQIRILRFKKQLYTNFKKKLLFPLWNKTGLSRNQFVVVNFHVHIFFLRPKKSSIWIFTLIGAT